MSSAATASAIGSYTTIRQLGSGGMGEIFLAHDASLGRDVAIKLLPEHLANETENLFRLQQEARAASSLNHPNIITIYEIGQHDSGAFMAMEYVDGNTLRDLLVSGPIPVRKALQIGAQIADGLAAAHKRGLVHRDLKPENVMITTDGVVKILDFGLAKIEGPNAQGVTDPGTIVGSYGYMSPEQARAGDVDYRSDQFSLGAILYEMLTGRRAFDGASGVETLFMIVRDEPAPLSVVAAHVPAPVRWVVDRCLSKDADDRYVSTRDLARELQYIRDHFSEAGITTPIKDEQTVAQKIRRVWPLAAAIVAALAIGSVATAIIRKPAPRGITAERYLTYSGNDFSPAVSPDGKLLAFSSNRDGTQRVWIKQVASGSEVALTPGRDDFPRFSPDGSTVLYQHVEPGKPAALWKVPVVGGEARRVVDNAVSGDWSADGKRLAYTRNVVGERDAAASVVFVANADGTGSQELVRTDATLLAQPRWSPDGKYVAAIGARGRVNQSILLIDVENKTSKFLSHPPNAGETSSVVWSHDGKSLFYVRAESVEAVVGSSAQVVRHNVAKDTYETIGWSSHNGAVLDVLDNGKLVLDVRSPRDNLREMQIGGEPHDALWMTRGNSSDRQPVYAPDGKTLLFTSNRSGNLDLWTITREGGMVRRITDDAAEDWDPAFTADGQKVIWSSARSGNLEIWIANADGSDAKQISKDGFDAENPSATPDGQWVIYNSFHQQKMGVWKVRADGSEATHLIKGRTAVPEVSPDGQYVAYIANARTAGNEIRVARVSDGTDMGFTIPIRNQRRTSSILGRMRWTPDSKGIAFLGQDQDGVNGVFVQDFVPGQDTTASRRPLGGFDRETATESFGLSRDGKQMTVAGWEQLFSLFSIEGVPEVIRKTEKKES